MHIKGKPCNRKFNTRISTRNVLLMSSWQVTISFHQQFNYYQEYIIEREGEYRTRVYYCGTTLRKVTHPFNDIHACKYKVLNRRQPRGHDLTFAIAYRTYTRVCCCTSSWRHRPSRSVVLSPVRRSPRLLRRQVAGSKRQSSDAGRLVDHQAPPKA